MFELFIARRYLRAKRKQVVISVITVISVIGVAAGVMALVIALAINNGFRSHARNAICWALTAHVSIQEKEPGEGIDGWEQLAAQARAICRTSKAPRPRSTTAGISPDRSMATASRSRASRSPNGAPVPDALLHLKAGSIEGLRSAEGELPGNHSRLPPGRKARRSGREAGHADHSQRPDDSLRPAAQLRARCASPEFSNPASSSSIRPGLHGSSDHAESFRTGRRA